MQLQLGWPAIQSGVRRVMFQQGAAMAGHLLVLLAMGLQARYVLADARGLLPPRRRKPAATPGGKEDRGRGRCLGGGRFSARRAAAGLPSRLGRNGDGDGDQNRRQRRFPRLPPRSQQKLSKADRKALKNRLIQERLKRQQQADTAWGG